jgi:phage baseplate assembly protein V
VSQGRLLERMARSVRLSIARGVLRLVNDAAGIQLEQVALLDGEVRSSLERFQHYGFSSVCKPGAERIVLFPGGSRDVGYVVADDDRRYRIRPQAEGEVAIYHLDGETWIKLKNGGELEVFAGTRVRLNAPTIALEADTITLDATVAIEMTAPTISGDAATTLDLAAPAIGVAGGTSVVITGPLLNLQGKGDYKGHRNSGVNAGSSNSGAVV